MVEIVGLFVGIVLVVVVGAAGSNTALEIS
jgi:hypothetical protein